MDPRKTVKEILAGFEINLPEIYQSPVIEAMIAGMVIARGDERRDWTHALKQAVESQFPDWGDFHEWPAAPDVEVMCEWLKRLIGAEREDCAKICDPPDRLSDLLQTVLRDRAAAIRARGEKV